MKILLDGLADLFNRDLSRLEKEIERITDDQLWEKTKGVTNSCGILAQHLVGNLNHYIGTALGNTGYIRDRKREFTNTGVSADKLIADINETREMISTVFDNLGEESLSKPYPLEAPIDGSTRQFLHHLYGHLNYHLGQVNYLRRILEENQG